MFAFVRHSRRSKRLAAAVAAAYCAGNLWSFVHFAFVEHLTCPEHGEMMHVSAEQANAIAAARHLSFNGTDAFDVSAPTSISHEHDPCHLLSSLRDRFFIAIDRAAIGDAGALANRAPRPEDGEASGSTLWRLAPKQSPPV